MYKVYAHINKINNKIYIGITRQKVEKRWQKGKGYIGCQHFFNAICKYGWDNFEHIILEDNLTEQQAKQKEMLYIKLYNTTNENFGYNMTIGGEGGLKYKNDNERQKARKETCKKYYNRNKNQIKKYIEENKDKVKARTKKWEEENKDKLKEYKKQWRIKNKEKLLLKEEEYRKKNEDKLKKYKKEYYEKNKEKIKERRRNYYKINKK